ncbi:MAG: hypothetical protein ACO23T_07130 [Hylemonella sp.]
MTPDVKTQHPMALHQRLDQPGPGVTVGAMRVSQADPVALFTIDLIPYDTVTNLKQHSTTPLMSKFSNHHTVRSLSAAGCVE